MIRDGACITSLGKIFFKCHMKYFLVLMMALLWGDTMMIGFRPWVPYN